VKKIIRHAIPYTLDSVSLFEKVRDLPEAIWLDSGKPKSVQGNIDIISSSADLIIETRGKTSTIKDSAGSRRSSCDPFTLAQKALSELQPLHTDANELPFAGGILGFFSYNLGQTVVDVPTESVSVTNLPDMRIGRYLWALLIYHETQRAEIIFHEHCGQDLKADIIRRFSEPVVSGISGNNRFKLKHAFKGTLTKTQYIAAIGNIKKYINDGDCYQVNFTQHFSAQYEGSEWQAYLKMRNATASPYSAFWKWSDATVMCVSPERFVKISNNNSHLAIETKPIKGTLRRGKSVTEDKKNAEKLQNSAKDRAENLMIVDLLRNDISKNCIPGTVKVPRLFALESFPNVHHLVSTIVGQIESNRTPLGVLRDCFPGGSITGAPKKRAMEIIEELEPVKRSVYCGSIGYISANNQVDTNIAIRTVIACESTLHCWGGGGIIADSQAESEFDESLTKINIILKTLEQTI
jgi:para-aminobenzoate synthetase component 1